MTVNCLIINLPIRERVPPTRFPHGLGYVAAMAMKNNHHVRILDLNILRIPPAEQREAIAKALVDVDVVLMGGVITLYRKIVDATAFIKSVAPRVVTIVGGTATSSLSSEYFTNKGIDILVKGEAESSLPQLLGKIQKKTFTPDSSSDGKPLVFTSDRVSHLDIIPFPAYRHFETERYVQNARGQIDIIAGRGCPFKCTFCFRNFGNKVYVRHPENIISEMIFLRQQYGSNHFHIEDELFVQNRVYINDFCNRLNAYRKSDLLAGITWSACTRANTADKSVLLQLKDSGCTALMVGLESFSDEVLAMMNKNCTAEDNHRICDLANQVGITIHPGLIIGMPNDTPETVEATIAGCIRHKIKLNEWSYAFLTPYPGTAVYDYTLEKRIITDEAAYLDTLCRVGDTCDLTLNLTQMKDEELIQLRNYAIRYVNQHIAK